MHLGATQPALRLDCNLGIAGDRRHVPVSIRTHPQPLLPAGLHGRRSRGPCPQPAGPHGHQRARRGGRPRHVVDRAGLHLRAPRDKRYRLVAVEQDPPRGDLIAEPGRPGLEPGATRPGDHRRALGLNLERLQFRLATRTTRRGFLPAEHDRQQFTGELVGRTSGHRADDLHLILTGDHVGRHIQTEAATTGDEHGCRVTGRVRLTTGSSCRLLLPRQEPALHALQSHPYVAVKPDRVDATNAGALIRCPRAWQQPRQECPTTSGRPSIPKLHHFRGADLELLEFHVTGDDLDVVVGARRRGGATDRHLPAEAAADEPREPALPQVERLVELKHGPLRHP